MNYCLRLVASSLSLVILLMGQGYSTNNNNETDQQYKARVASQQTLVSEPTKPQSGSYDIQPLEQPLPVVPVSTGSPVRTDAQIIAPLVQRVSNAPSILSLSSSIKIQSVCRVFMTPNSADEMNNVFTNLAYEQAVKLYAQHGDRFIEPFTEQIHGMIFGVFESSLKKAIGVGELISAFQKLSGIRVSGKEHFTDAANRNLPRSVLDALRLKFATDLLNKHVVGPYVVAPNIAYAVNQINFGQILQDQLFVRVVNLLHEFEDELVERSVDELKVYAAQIVLLNEELQLLNGTLLPDLSDDDKRQDAEQISALKKELDKLQGQASAELAWSEYLNPMRNSSPKELVVAQKREELSALEQAIRAKKKIRQDQRDNIKRIEDEIVSLNVKGQAVAQALIAAGRYNNQGQATEADITGAQQLLKSGITLREQFGELPFIGKAIDRYMAPCPHIQPGILSSMLTENNLSLVAVVPRGYLRLTGVTGSVNRLREVLSPEAFQRTVDETVSGVNGVRDAVHQLSVVQLTPNSEQLEAQGYVGAGLTRLTTAVRGGVQVLHHGTRAISGTMTLHRPAVNHLRRIQADSQQMVLKLHLAATPARVSYNFLIHVGQIWALNYFSNLVRGVPVTDHTYTIAFTIAIMQQLYILIRYMI
jgi:hypothetical protein